MKKILAFVLLITIIALSGFFIRARSKKASSVDVIIKEIVALQRLETALVVSESIVETKDQSGSMLRDMLFGDKLLLVARGEVVAGIDFSQIKKEDINQTENSITLLLPPAQILYSRIDNEKTRVFDRRTGILTKGNTNLESEARLQAERAIREAACEANILNMANTNAQKQLRALIAGLTNVEVDIQTQNGVCR